MKSHPIIEAIAVFVSLAASACISIDDHDDKPKTTTITKETVTSHPLTNPTVTTTETTTTRSR